MVFISDSVFKEVDQDLKKYAISVEMLWKMTEFLKNDSFNFFDFF